MFQDNILQDHLETSSTIRLQSAVIAEWNMNVSGNIHRLGNYRHRPLDPNTSKYKSIPDTFDENDEGNFYTNATDADVVVDGGYNDSSYTGEMIPIAFRSKKEKENLLYSLEDCLNKFRPRSGINKLRYFDTKFTHFSNPDMCSRPRYYLADKKDKFKYWTSYRTENGVERGISNGIQNGQFFIDDAAPYVAYKEEVPANRLVVKMQTGIGSIDLGPFTDISGTFNDPFFGIENSSIPETWKIQVLKSNNWIDVASFNKQSKRKDGSSIVGSDGYLELAYGLVVPDRYAEIFTKVAEYPSESLLPTASLAGNAYLIKANEFVPGYYQVWIDGNYERFEANYGWYLIESEIDNTSSFVTNLTLPDTYISSTDGNLAYKEFDKISGIRIVVDTMSSFDSTFDLIEMSPRLSVDLSDKTQSFSIKKNASDLGISGMPVGQLLASTGDLKLFDYDQAFSDTNTSSLIAKYSAKNIQFKFYEIVVDVNGTDYYVPMKTLYSEQFPQISHSDRSVSISLRDMFSYFESITAPELLIQNVSLSYAVSLLLDSVGFSNYTFKRNAGESDDIIDNFYVSPDKSIAQILQDLAISTQSAMFFDEYNNFVVFSKNYIMPSITERSTDTVLYGSVDTIDTGVLENYASARIANIIDISSQNNAVYNDGKIVYSSKYIQKTYGSLKQAMMIDKDKTWIYKPVLLWEVSGTGSTKSINNESSGQSSYVLGAIPLNSDLSSNLPTVKNNVVVDNIIDFGEGVYWMTRYNGYFYANGEVIRYDAVEYSIPKNGTANSNVWITSNQEYQNYFSKISFNGKIYPTGRVRIYSEPNYEVVNGITKLKNGAVAKHGRMQFGTGVKDANGAMKPAEHKAELSAYWYDNANVRGCKMDSSYLFNLSVNGTGGAVAGSISTVEGEAGFGSGNASNLMAQKTTRNGVIRNFLSTSYVAEDKANAMHATQTGTIQSSALIMNGPNFATTENPLDFVSYVYKPLNNKFKHFGTRMRIVGKINNSTTSGQTPIGSTPYYNLSNASPNQSVRINGASGGLAMMINPLTNNGYYFEIATLTENNIDSYNTGQEIHNIVFYKVMKDSSSTDPLNPKKAVPVKLWGGLSNILVDDGKFTGQYRVTGETNPTVYDLAVEYQDIGKIRRFFLYINNKLITTVDDNKPLTVYNNMALFVRGSSRVMFENIYAITNNYSQNTVYSLNTPVNSVFSNQEINVNESFRKYAMSGVIQSTYLSGISPGDTPQYDIYFDEFGTLMREASYFNVRYDKAYPALFAKISPTFNRIKGYTVSGFTAGAYGAEFLVFNATDTALTLDESSGNYLRIQGVTFTQESNQELTVDDFFSKQGDLSNPQYSGTNLVSSPTKSKKDYEDIRVSRINYGKNEFTLNVPYIQSSDSATNMMKWITSKVMKPRKSIGIKIFAMPTIQLGDIVSINFKDSDNVDQVASQNSRFTVYSIDYQRDQNGPSMTVYLSEVM
jgi:hypothetical protein